VKITRILLVLLTSIPLTRREISKQLGLTKSYSGHDPITEPMRMLITAGILISKEKKREVRDKRGREVKVLGKGRLSELWELDRNIRVLRTIYADYPELREIIGKTDWVYDVIVQQGLNPDGIDNVQGKDIRNLHKMLQLSPSFFHICLTSPSIKQTAAHWSYIRDNRSPKPSKKLVKHYIDRMQPRHYPFRAYYDLFTFCLFSDEISDKSTDEEYKLLETFRKIWQQKERGMIQWNNVEIMQGMMIETLKRVCRRASEDNGVLDQIKKQISRYDHEDAEYKKMELDMLDGRAELTPEMVDASFGRKKSIVTDMVDLLELGDILVPH
jgi:hypothetical protein